MVTIPNLSDGKTSLLDAAFQSDGDTIPIISASGGEVLGDVVVRTVALQAIAVVVAIANDSRETAVAADIMSCRVAGMHEMKKHTGALADGARVEYDATNGITANATGAHEVVGGWASGDTHCAVRINVFPDARTP